MLHPRCLLAALALYLSLEELSAFLLPHQIRQKRDDGNWPDDELSLYLSEFSDLGDRFPMDTAESARDWGTRQSRPSTFHAPLERLSVPHHSTHHRKTKDKRRRVSAPLDSIGSTFVSTLRSRKEDPENHKQHYAE